MLQVETNVSFEFSNVELDQMMSVLEYKEQAKRKLAAKNVVKVGMLHVKLVNLILKIQMLQRLLFH